MSVHCSLLSQFRSRLFGSAVVLTLGCSAALPVFAQPPAKKATEPPPKTATEPAKTEAEPAAAPAGDADFEALLGRWKALIEDLRKLKLKYAIAQPGEREALDKQWAELIAQGNEMIPQLREAGKKAFAAAPNADPQLTRFLVKMAVDDAAADHYQSAFDLAELLIKNECDEKQIYNAAGIAAFGLNNFDKADEYFKKARELGSLAAPGEEYASATGEYKGYWAAESKLREAEAAANDLPRVKIQTNKGDIVLELFENEAPDTVGNFVSLVEKGFYDGTPFHRVLKGFMAQGGDPTGDGTGGPGYQIFCETDKPNARKHFAGSLSMAHAGKDTGGSQFFLTFRPTPHLNGRHTCFGRVVEGIDVLEKLQRRDPSAPNLPQPDKIVKATVERKRDHAYVPKKVE
jgi:cyclophilin family peptidyl-prolyl cis-trans isomerase